MLPTESVNQGCDVGYASSVTFCGVYLNERGPEIGPQRCLHHSLMFHGPLELPNILNRVSLFIHRKPALTVCGDS